MIKCVVSDAVLPKHEDDVFAYQVLNCELSSDCVPFRAGSASPPMKCFSSCPVLVHRSFFHKVEILGSDYMSVEFDLPVHKTLR